MFIDHSYFLFREMPVCVIFFPIFLSCGLSFFFFLINLFIYLFLAALGLRCSMRAFSSCGEWGLLFVVVRGFLITVASLVAEHGL